MITAPGGYAAWASWCEAFGRGEDLPATHLISLVDASQAELRVRIIGRLTRAYEVRRARWADQLQRDLDHLDPANPAALAQLLTTARARLAPLSALARSPLLATDLRTEIGSDLASTVANAQQELERIARQNPVVERAMLHTVRQYPLALGLTSDAVAAYISATTVVPGTGRRVVI